jgi:hypothetical protein
MGISTHPTDPATQNPELYARPEPARRLPSGRSVIVKMTGDCEEVEIRDLEGQVEVSVSLTADGPVVRVHGGRLELHAVDTVAVACRRLEIQTAESTDLRSDAELRVTSRELKVRTSEDIHLNGAFIRLNC